MTKELSQRCFEGVEIAIRIPREKMKATLNAAFICRCGWIMPVNGNGSRNTPLHEAEYLACSNPECEEYEIRYKIPFYELEPIEEE